MPPLSESPLLDPVAIYERTPGHLRQIQRKVLRKVDLDVGSSQHHGPLVALEPSFFLFQPLSELFTPLLVGTGADFQHLVNPNS